MDVSVIEKYERGGDSLIAAIQGLAREDFLAFPVPGTWSIQQIVIHMLDSDNVGVDRMKRIIAEENPLLIGYNETLFAKNLFYDKLDPFLAEVFKKNRLLMAAVLRNLSANAFERAGIHNERGKVTLAGCLNGYIEHLEHHLKFLRKKRELLGKPLK